MPKTMLHNLSEFGQSIWLDYISRPLIESGKLKGLVDEGLRGMTSNPTLFHQAISTSRDYDSRMIQLIEKGQSTFEIYDDLTIRDIQEAADIFQKITGIGIRSKTELMALFQRIKGEGYNLQTVLRDERLKKYVQRTSPFHLE